MQIFSAPCRPEKQHQLPSKKCQFKSGQNEHDDPFRLLIKLFSINFSTQLNHCIEPDFYHIDIWNCQSTCPLRRCLILCGSISPLRNLWISLSQANTLFCSFWPFPIISLWAGSGWTSTPAMMRYISAHTLFLCDANSYPHTWPGCLELPSGSTSWFET